MRISDWSSDVCSSDLIDPAELSPGEFAANVRASVEQDGARVVVIDSLNGYLSAMPDERFLILQMHELLSYLGQQGVLTILVLAQRSEEHTSELQSLMRISYAVFCLKKKKNITI